MINQQKTSKDDQVTTTELDSLHRYLSLGDPIVPIIKRSLVIMAFSIFLYLIFGFWVPDHPQSWYPLLSWLHSDYSSFETWVQNYLSVSYQLRWNRLMLICYLSLYLGMWWAYFQSKFSPEKDIEVKRLKIQTLRRLLGTSAKQWEPQVGGTVDDYEVIETYRRKSTAGMDVIAILIAVSILIFDQISNIWMSAEQFTLWQYTILWLGMFSAVISFICYMMCVDALDTIFNRFSNDPVRNVLVKYFYDYTLNPRYAATATMLLSIILLLSIHSEVLASMAIAIILWIGYKFWFPNIRDLVTQLEDTPNAVRRVSFPWHIPLLLLPLIIRAITYVIYA